MKYKIIKRFIDGSEETVESGFDTYEAAHAEAGRIWFDDYNAGRSRHTPSMGHNSGVAMVGVREDEE